MEFIGTFEDVVKVHRARMMFQVQGQLFEMMSVRVESQDSRFPVPDVGEVVVADSDRRVRMYLVLFELHRTADGHGDR